MKELRMVCVLVLVVMVFGCVTEKAYWDPETSTVISISDYEQLPTAEQEGYVEVEVETIKPEVIDRVDKTAAVVEGVVAVTRPVIPEPFATGIVALLVGLVGIWQTVKKRKVLDTLDKVKLGAQITADSVDKVVRPATELYVKFASRQKAESANTDAIMPDKLGTIK